MSIFGDIAANLVRSTIQRVVNGMAVEYGLTPVQVTALVDGIMVALQVGGEIYEDGGKKPTP